MELSETLDHHKNDSKGVFGDTETIKEAEEYIKEHLPYVSNTDYIDSKIPG